MKDIDEIRRDNLRLIESELGGPAEAASRAGMSPAQFINLRSGAKDSKTGKPRGMRKGTARRIEQAVGKSAGWLDIDHSLSVATGHVQMPSINERFASATPEIQTVVEFFLSQPTAPTPGWVDSDARAYADSLEAKARRWLQGGSESAIKKIRA